MDICETCVYNPNSSELNGLGKDGPVDLMELGKSLSRSLASPQMWPSSVAIRGTLIVSHHRL
jgi:hypothetical protein